MSNENQPLHATPGDASGGAVPWALRAFLAVVLVLFAAVVLVIAALSPVFAFLERLEKRRERQGSAEDDDGTDDGVYPGLHQDYTPSKFASLHENRST